MLSLPSGRMVDTSRKEISFFGFTREQAAAALYRFAEQRGRDVSVQGDLNSWIDGASVSADNAAGVIWALEHGLMSAFADGTVRPGQTVTCGEAVVMIRTMQQKL